VSGCSFFFQAEDGIRDWSVTGVQTCALPIWEITDSGGRALAVPTDVGDPASVCRLVEQALGAYGRLDAAFNNAAGGGHGPKPLRSEERRVGKEGKNGGGPHASKKRRQRRGEK